MQTNKPSRRAKKVTSQLEQIQRLIAGLEYECKQSNSQEWRIFAEDLGYHRRSLINLAYSMPSHAD